MAYYVLHPDLTRQLLHGEQDALSAANEKRITRIKDTPCPRCGASLHPRLNTAQPFSERSPLPRLLATCECGFEQDTETGLIIDRGKATRVQDPLPIVKPSDD